MSLAVVSDTCHYLPPALIAEHEIHQVSLYVRFGDDSERESEITDYADYYRRLADLSGLPTTSQPSIGDFLAVYEPLLEQGKEIISVHLSGGISGTYRAALQARDALAPELAEKVQVVDSTVACMGEGLAVLAAAAVAKRGGSAAEAAAAATAAAEQLRLNFAVDTLEYLRRGGRIGGASAWLGTALKIKPILDFQAGELHPLEKVRTSKRAMERMVTLLQECKDAGLDAWAVQHIQAPDEAQQVVARGREIFGIDPVVVSEIGPVIGTHVGPGLIGAGAISSALL